MPIKNLSDVRRMPRLGKIGLGIKKKASSGSDYPAEVDYFVCPPSVEKVFGKEPKQLRIMIPVENTDVFFQQWYKCYGASLLKCKGDGEKAFTWDEGGGGMKEIPCPCDKLDKKECKQIGILQFLLPDVPGAGVWQITTSSRNSIIDLNSSIDFVRGICGRVRMIPLILKREKMEMQRVEDGKPKKSTHYTLKIDLDENMSLRQLQQAAQVTPERVLLPPPDESKDDLLYPANGFKPDAEPEAEDEHDPVADARYELLAKMGSYERLGGKVSTEAMKRAAALDNLKDIQAKITEFDKAIKEKQSGLFQ